MANHPRMLAFPSDGFIALHLPRGLVPPAAQLEEADGVLVRFKSAEGFKAFLVDAIQAAAQVWPEIAAEWNDGQ